MENHETLEQIIDDIGLDHTLEILANVCYDKAEHLGPKWQDHPAAKSWENAASQIERIQVKCHVG